MIHKSIIILVFAFYSCGTDITTVAAEQTEEQTSLLVTDILKNNPSVKIGPILSKDLNKNLPCTGFLSVPPTELISIHSKSAGHIEFMKYVVGDYVKKGALLYTINNPSLVEKQRIFLEAKVELDLANKEFGRKELLQQKQAISSKDFDQGYARKKLIEAKYEGLKSELKLLGTNINLLESEHKFQEKVFIYAPQSGFVSEVLVNKGQMIHPEIKLMEIINKQKIYLELKVLTKDVALVKKGQQVLFSVDNNQTQLSAVISQLSPVVSDNGTLMVYCKITSNVELPLKTGMFINAEILLGNQTVKGVPLDAVIQEGENYYAYFVKNKSLVKEELQNVQIINNFVGFDNLPEGDLLLQGAYYIEP